MAEAKADVFLLEGERRDFALLVEDTKVFVNREYLANWSPIFAKIFYPEGAPFEQPEGGMLMKEKKLDEFLVFLHAICPTSKALRVDQSNVAVLVAYADEYDVAVLRERCVEFVSDQAKGKVEGKKLVDYLRLCSLYNLKDLQKELVPLVAQLAFEEITATHTQLPLSVLSVIYQSKALSLQAAVEDSSSLPEQAFFCTGCSKTTCSIFKGASLCCNKSVSIASAAVAQVEAKCVFTCVKCNKSCSLTSGGSYRFSSCCTNYLVVYAKWGVSKKRSANGVADGPPPKGTHFSADLLDRDK